MPTIPEILADMLAYKREQFEGDQDTDLSVSGADLVDAFTVWRQQIKEAQSQGPSAAMIEAAPNRDTEFLNACLPAVWSAMTREGDFALELIRQAARKAWAAIPPWRTEFSDFDDSTSCAALVEAGYRDSSWRNDACPSFIKGRACIFVDYIARESRECPEVEHRFQVDTLADDGEDLGEWETFATLAEAMAYADTLKKPE